MSERATLTVALSGPSALATSIAITFTGSAPGLRLPLTGAQTYDVDLAMMPATGLHCLVVLLDALDDAGSPIEAPITITWSSNAEEKSEELTALPVLGALGVPGVFVIGSPAAVHGVTALSIVTTSSAVVHVHALG